MRSVTLFALCAALLIGWSAPGLAQSTGEGGLYAAFDLAPPHGATVQGAGALFSDTVQRPAGLGNFFAFDPPFREGVSVVRPSGDSQGGQVVVGSTNGGQGRVAEQPGPPEQLFFPFDPSF